jgi:hypothetical protein
MASYSGFLRKSPGDRLKELFIGHGVDVPDEFDWNSAGRGTAFVAAVDDFLAQLPGYQYDRIKADLDHLSSLANDGTIISAEQVCIPAGIGLEGMEGIQDILLMLATKHRDILERVAVQASMNRRTGGQGWASFQFADDGKPWALDDDMARDGFLHETLKILALPDHRRHESDWYTTLHVHPITGEETHLTHATIYVEERAASELAFGETALERRVVPKVLEVALACNAQGRSVEICAKGGKKIRDQYAQAFATHFAPHSEPPIEVPRRNVMLDVLRASPRFATEPADGIEQVDISSLEFFSHGGGFARYEKRGDDETIYQFLDRRFGDKSPLQAGGWMMTAVTMRIKMAPQDGRRTKTHTVTLRTPNTTTIPNKTDSERQFVFSLLERWGLVSPPDHFDLIDAV